MVKETTGVSVEPENSAGHKQGSSGYKITMIIPVYNEAENIYPVWREIERVFYEKLPGYEWEILLVNDGSADESWQVIKELSARERNVSGLNLSRNFGKEMALTAGVESVEDTDAVIFLDADMQHPPYLIPDFVQKWQQGAEIVVGIRDQVADYSFVKKIGSKAFYFFLRYCSDVDIPPNSTDFRLLDKKVVHTLGQFSERSRMFRGLIDWMGFNKDYITFNAPERNQGKQPSYSYRKLFQLAINSMTSFSLLPLRITGYLGILVCLFTGLLILYMLLTQILFGAVYTPLAYFVVFNTFLVGTILSALGMIALYIGHIHTETVGRPLYIVREKIGKLTKSIE